MKNIFISNQYKIYLGIGIFTITIAGILFAFVLSVVLFVSTVVRYAFEMSVWMTPFIFLALFFSLMLYLNRNAKMKVIFFNALLLFFFLGSIDVAKMVWPAFDLRNSVRHLMAMEEVKTIDEYRPIISSSEINVSYENKDIFFESSDVLGYVPARNKKTRTYATYKSDTLFDVHYTIDKDGLRLSPPFIDRSNSESLLFFGCSLTFGYGLEDFESVPYMTGYKTHGKYKVYNLAFNGYGTHQMVSALEQNYIDTIVKVTPQHIFYVGISDHINRIVNKKDWGAHDPKYELNHKGEAVYVGHFDDYRNTLMGDLFLNLEMVYHKISASSYVLTMLSANQLEVTEEDKELFIALVAKAKSLAKLKYPQAEFHMIYWPLNKDLDTKLLDRFAEMNIDVRLITDIIPDHRNFKKYWIKYPLESHPNSVANDVISSYIVDEILNQ